MNAYLSIPLMGSAFVETREQWVGFGTERHPRGDREIYLGYLQVTYSPPADRRISRKTMVFLFAVASLVVLAGAGHNTDGGIWLPNKKEIETSSFPQLITNPSLDILFQTD
jgi:hypothetical protein